MRKLLAAAFAAVTLFGVSVPATAQQSSLFPTTAEMAQQIEAMRSMGVRVKGADMFEGYGDLSDQDAEAVQQVWTAYKVCLAEQTGYRIDGEIHTIDPGDHYTTDRWFGPPDNDDLAQGGSDTMQPSFECMPMNPLTPQRWQEYYGSSQPDEPTSLFNGYDDMTINQQ